MYKWLWHCRSLPLMKNEKCVKHSLWVHYVESPHSTIAFKGVKTIFTYNRWLTRRYLQVSGEDKITMLHLIQKLHMTTRTFVASIPYLGDSSPVSSSPSTPTRRTVSSIPAVWYLRANAFSSGKNPICTLNNTTH